MLTKSARRFGALVSLLSLAVQAQESPADIPATAFAKLGGYVGAQLSPDGERIAFLYPVDSRWRVHVHSFAAGDGFRMPISDEMDYNWLRWANNDTIVISMSYTAARQLTGTIETRLFAFHLATSDFISLIPPARTKNSADTRIGRKELPPPQIQDNVIDWIPDDPDHILVSLDEDHDNAAEVRKIELATGRYKIVRNSSQGVQRWFADDSGNIRFGFGYRNARFFGKLELANGDWITLADKEWFQEGWFPQGFTSDPSKIFVMGPGEYGTREVRILDPGNGEFGETVFADPKYDAESMIRHPLTDHLVGTNYVTHRREQQYFDEEMNVLQKSIDTAFPHTTNRIQSLSQNKRKILFQASSDTDPGVLYIWNRDSKGVDSFGTAMQLIDPRLMSPVEAVEYASDDGTVIPAYLTLPAGTERSDLPTVILPHGGPAERDDQSFRYLPQFLASRGYAVLQPNFRGSTGYGVEFENAGHGQWGGLMQDDVTAGAQWLIDQGIANKDRICIVGWSYGGYAAAFGLVKTPDLYQCGVSINGVYDLPELISNDRKYIGGSAWAKHIGLDGESARSVSPYHQVDLIRAPLLIFHADDDGRVDVSQAKSMARRMEKQDKVVTLIRFPLGGHSMINESARLEILENIETFLQDNIGKD
jgi:dipeptidyl aminopeptidase/acylaminoacyl peptidase